MNSKIRRSSRQRSISFALAVGAALLLPAAWASHFGGPSTGGGAEEPAEPRPPCSGGGVECSPGQDAGAGCSDQPIDLYSGAKHYKVTDMDVAGEQPIRLTRFYDSQSDYDSPLGHGWAFVHDRRLYEYPDGSIVIRYHCGERTRFVPAGGGFEAEIGGLRGDLEEVPGTGHVFTYASGRKDRYDLEGRLTEAEDRRGNKLVYSYDPAGKLPLIGASAYAVDPGQPMIVAYSPRLIRIEAFGADGGATGRYVEFGYDAATGRLASAADHTGRTVLYHHDATEGQTLGNLVRVEGLAGVEAVYAYDDPQDRHNLTGYVPSAGTTPQINEYDDLDRVERQTFGNRVLDIAYPVELTHTVVTRTVVDADGLNPRTAVTEYFFDLQGYVETIVAPQGHETRYTYTADHWVDTRETWEDTGTGLVQTRTVDYDYTTEGLKSSEVVTLASGEVITKAWTYDHGWVATETVSSSTDPGRSFRTEYEFVYGAGGAPRNIQAVKRRRDDGSYRTTSYTYDARNRLETTTLPDGVVVVNTYTGNDLTGVHYRVGGSALPELAQTFGYDDLGRRTHSRDARNNLTQLGYDEQGRVTAITNPLGEQTVLTYTGEDLTEVEIGKTDTAAGVRYRLGYDPEHRLTTVERQDAGGTYQLIASYTYDSDGNRLSATDGAGLTTRFAYDLNGRLVQVIDPDGNPTAFEYDARGNRTRLIDANNNETRYVYDALNRLIRSEQLGISPTAVTAYDYDANGNLTGVTDPESNATTYVYDALSQLRQVVQPLGQTVTHEYDARGRIDHTINARGHKLDYGYAPWGPVTGVDYYPNAVAVTPDYVKTFSYDLDGNLTEASDSRIQPGALYTTTYDALSRPDQVTVSYIPGKTVLLDHDYDRFGNRSQLLLDEGVPMMPLRHGYVYDAMNRLQQVELPGADPITLSYTGNDRLDEIQYPGGLNTDFTYADAGPVQSITVQDAQGVIEEIVYSHDAVLNIDTRTDGDGPHDYDYDGVNRLVQALHPAGSGLPGSEDFSYDLVGNREDPGDSSAYDYDANNRLIEQGGTIYQYDDDGNLSLRGGETYTHDMDSRLVAYGDGVTTASYQYDPLGRRIAKTVDGVTTYFLWDGSSLLAEYDASGNRIRRYAYMPGGHLPVQYADGNGAYWVHGDHLQAPRVLTDPDTHEIVWRGSFLAYGETVIDEDPDGDGVGVVFNPRFPGQYEDSESGLYYNYFRNYDPALGRYVQADPIGLNGGINVYSYVLGNSVNFVDPSGLIVGLIAGQGLRKLTGQTAQEAAIGGKIIDSHGAAVVTGMSGEIPVGPGIGVALDSYQGVGGIQTIGLSTVITYGLYGASATLGSAGAAVILPLSLSLIGGAEVGLATGSLYERIRGNSIGSDIYNLINECQ